MTRCESYPLCSGTIYFPTAPYYIGLNTIFLKEKVYFQQILFRFFFLFGLPGFRNISLSIVSFQIDFLQLRH